MMRSQQPGRRALAPALVAAVAALAPAQSESSGLYSLPRNQDDLAELERAREELDSGEHGAAVQRLHELVERGSPGVVPAPVGIDRFQGVRQAVIEVLRETEGEARAAYERLVRRQAGHLVEQPLTSLRTEQLEQLAREYPVADIGLRARLRLGDLALERGDALAAERHFRAAADCDSDLPGLDVRRLAAKALASGTGDGPIAERIAELRPASAPGRWPSYGGGGSGARTMTAPVGRPAPIASRQIFAQGYLEHPYRPNPFPMHAVGDLDGIYVNDGESVWALDSLGLEPGPRWHAPGPMSELGPGEFDEVMEAINPDFALAAAIDDALVIAPLLVPNDLVGASETQTFKGSINIIRKISSRRLHAFERATGKLLWAHWDHKGGPTSNRFSGHDACGPPLIVGDLVIAPTHDQTGAIAYYLSAYDLHTGETQWRRLICSSGQEVNMFGNARQEFAAAPLAVHEGVVYGATNLGVCFAVDAADGAIRWVSGYEPIPLPRTQLRDQKPRPVFFANNPPVVAEGVLACTPLDSEYALGFEIETGRQLWKLHHDHGRQGSTVRWLLGALDGEFVFSGLGIVAVEPQTRPGDGLRPRARIVASPEQLGEENAYRLGNIPRGAITEDRIWFLGSSRQLEVVDAQGHRDARRNGLPLPDLGNLLLTDGVAVVVRSGAVTIHADLSRLEEDAERRVRRTPDDPEAYLRLARILLADTVGRDEDPGRLGRALDVYERGLEAARAAGLGDGSSLFRRLADGRFDLALRRARATARRDLASGLQLLRACRDGATDPEQWITAQLYLIAALDGRELVEELDRMRAQHGDRQYRFPGVGRIPVSAYGLWQSIAHVPPRDSVARAQELMERFGDVRLGAITGREFATKRIAALIGRHGREVYAAIELAAGAALERAGDDRDALDAVARRYPHSDAASRATSRLIDFAVAEGDLATAARVFADTDKASPGTIRRMMVAAGISGNHALAHALGVRLESSHGDERSDYGPDEGRTYAQIASEIAAPTLPESPASPVPTALLGVLEPPNVGTALEFFPVTAVAGFADAPAPPLCVAVDGRELRAFDPRELPERVSDASWTLPVRDIELHEIVQCGSTLVVCEHTRVRGVDVETGAVAWGVEAAARRHFAPLGVIHGVVTMYSAALTGGDGGLVIGVEPLSGAILYERLLPANRNSFTPVRAPNRIWYWETTPRPTIVGLDPLTGDEAARIVLGDSARSFLGIDGDDAYRVQNLDLQTRFFADERKIVIPIDPDSDSSRPRCLAIDHEGRTIWRWSGSRGQSLAMVAPHGDRTVILSAGRQSELVILDAHGQRHGGKSDLGPQARVQNWRPNGRSDPAPDLLVLTDNPTAPRLTCKSLIASKPHFQRSLDRAIAILTRPLLGDDWLAIPVRTRSPDRHHRAAVFLVDLEDPLTRGLAELPVGDARSYPLPMQLASQGNLAIVESSDGLFFLGAPRSSDK